MENKIIISPMTVLSDLQAKKIAPEAISVETRQDCVELLLSKGATRYEMAELFKVCKRTIQRDIDCIRQSNAINPSLEMVSIYTGQLEKNANLACSQLLKIINTKNAKDADKIEANRCFWTIFMELTRTMQTLGYLPNAPTEINAKLSHAFAKAPNLAEINSELSSLETSISESAIAPDSGITETIAQIKTVLALSTASAQIKELNTKIKEQNND